MNANTAPTGRRANPFDLAGKVALVTGSTMGIGEGIARTLGQAGAHVVISSRKTEDCARVAQRFRDEGLSAEPRVCHIGRMEDIASMAAHLSRVHGGLDILVNNAVLKSVALDRGYRSLAVHEGYRGQSARQLVPFR